MSGAGADAKLVPCARRCGSWWPDPAGRERARNLRALNFAACAIHERCHVPIVGVNLALPIVEAAAPASYDAILLPLSLALAERCDAILRLPGASAGADLEVERVRARGGPVYASVAEIPRAGRSG